jgi:hypothetical protein
MVETLDAVTVEVLDAALALEVLAKAHMVETLDAVAVEVSDAIDAVVCLHMGVTHTVVLVAMATHVVVD